jgi:hypothetical protein
VAAAAETKRSSVRQAWYATTTFIAFSIEVSENENENHFRVCGHTTLHAIVLFMFLVSSSCRLLALARSLLSLSASCLHTMHFDDVVGWKPKCEVDGTFSAKQCRGDKITGRYNSICACAHTKSSLCVCSDASAMRRRARRYSAGAGGMRPTR